MRLQSYESRKKQLQADIEGWLRVIEVNKPIEPKDLSHILARHMMKTVEKDIRVAYMMGYHKGVDKVMSGTAITNYDLITVPILYVKDTGWLQ